MDEIDLEVLKVVAASNEIPEFAVNRTIQILAKKAVEQEKEERTMMESFS